LSQLTLLSAKIDMNCQQIGKRLNKSENIPKIFWVGYFFERRCIFLKIYFCGKEYCDLEI